MDLEIQSDDQLQTENVSIEYAVKFINEKSREILYVGYIEIGNFILKNFFDDDIELAFSRDPKKKESFNKLCQRKDLEVHPNRLAIMVKVASQERFFDNAKIDTKALTYTHKTFLVKLDNDDKKIKMLKKCIDKEWSTRKLEKEIEKLKLPKTMHGESFLRTTQKYITTLDNTLKSINPESLDFDEQKLSKMSLSKLRNLETRIETLKTKSEEISKLKELSEKSDEILEEIKKIIEEKKAMPSPKKGRPPKS